MPKNSKKSPPPITPVRERDRSHSGDTDHVPAEPLILALSHVQPQAVTKLKPKDPVLLKIDELPIWVTTPLGEPIGQVRLDDVDAVRLRKARRGTVVFAEATPLACAVEVR